MAVIVARLGRGGRVEVPINLLPVEIRARQRMRRIFVGVLVVAGALVLGLATTTVLQRRTISSAQSDLRAARAEAARLRSEVASLRQFGDMQARIDLSRATLGAALVGDVAWTRFLSDLAVTIPGDSWLTSLSMAAAPGQTPLGEESLGTVTYSGFVTTFPGLSGWLTRMDNLEGLRFVYLGSGSKQGGEGGGTVAFSATAHLTSSMLSGRCQGANAPCP